MNKEESELRFAEIRDMLYFMAYKMVWENEEVDELVSEAWCFDPVRECQLRHVPTQIEYAIWCWRRKRDGRANTSLKRRMKKAIDLSRIDPDQCSMAHEGFVTVDNKDFIEKLFGNSDSVSRKLLERRYCDGISGVQIAKEMGVSKRTLNRQLETLLERVKYEANQLEQVSGRSQI